MSRAIMVLNAGSSSLKFSIFEIVENQHLRPAASGLVEGIGTNPHFKACDHAGATVADTDLKSTNEPFTHQLALAHIAAWTREHFAGRLSLAGVGHRVVHGGINNINPTRITPAFLTQLEAITPLIPLHLPHNIAGINAVLRIQPDLPQVACFDTAFHQGRPPVTERYALPDEYFQKGLRRWGFHGLSYESIAAKFKTIAPDIAKGRVIVAHLGSGASLCAMHNSRSVDTTLGFSALDGLPMGTRCGSIDPGAVLYLAQQLGIKETESLLYKKSGLLGMSGISNDMRDLLASNDPRATAAVDYFVYRVTREIGALTATLGGLNALIFTAGIGERAPEIRRRICEGLTWLGVTIDNAANTKNAERISTADTSPSVWVIPTDEEAVIAAHTLALLNAAH